MNNHLSKVFLAFTLSLILNPLSAQNASPPVETSIPLPNATTLPAVEKSAPLPNASTPSAETSAPLPNATTPPAVEKSAPLPNASTPSAETRAPPPNATAPPSAVEKSAPLPNASTPPQKDKAVMKSGDTEMEQENLKASEQGAREWLQLVDHEKYLDSWQAGSLTFRLKIPQKSWVMLMDSLRKPLGRLSSRTLLQQRLAKDPKDLPKGDYMVVVFNSSFSDKKAAHELVTLVQESDGKWRVLTYIVQ